MNIKDYTIEELEAELLRRKDQKKPIARHEDDIDWLDVLALVTSVVDDVADGKPVGKDFKQRVFENVIEAIYGGVGFWTWWADNTP